MTQDENDLGPLSVRRVSILGAMARDSISSCRNGPERTRRGVKNNRFEFLEIANSSHRGNVVDS